MDKEHNHDGPWVLIIMVGVVLFILIIFTLAWNGYRINSAESRIMELEQRIECAAPEALFYDVDGNEVCLKPTD